jgi:predicted transposase/invertase (TIGR01784 family)
MVPGIKPTVDYVFKKVFGSEVNMPVLLSLTAAVLKPPPTRQIVGLTIRNPFNEKDADDDKLSILDIKASDELGRQYNIEMQMVVPRIFPNRALYYWARLHSGQLHEGFDYTTLQPTISISFVEGELFPQVPDYHLAFELRSTKHPGLVFSDHQVVHLIELPKFKKTAEELVDPLDVWCYFLVHGAELDLDNLPAALRTPAVQRAMEVLSMLAQNDQERQRYEARLKAERDRISFVNDALAEGRERQAIIGGIHTCQRLLKVPLTPWEDLWALSLADLQARAAALEQQFGAPAT